jgi:hypothetical protein
MLGKNGIFHGKSFEKSFFQEIPRNFPRKKMYEKSAPDKILQPFPQKIISVSENFFLVLFVVAAGGFLWDVKRKAGSHFCREGLIDDKRATR